MLLAATVMSFSMCLSILTQPFLSSHDVAIGNFGWLLAPGTILGIGASLMAYRITAKVGVNRVVALLPVGVMTVAVGLGAWNSVFAFVFLSVNSMVNAFAFPLVSDYLNQRIPSGQRATILSFYQLLFSLMLAPLEPVLGIIADDAGLQTAYRVAGILTAITCAPLLALWLRSVRNEARGARAVPEPVASG